MKIIQLKMIYVQTKLLTQERNYQERSLGMKPPLNLSLLAHQ